jgi:uncharacterized protein (TIGR03083 family)
VRRPAARPAYHRAVTDPSAGPSSGGPLRALLDDYRPQDPAEARDLPRLRALAGDPGSPWQRTRPLHFTASALVVHPASGRVLLRWHQRQQAWLQVGGHGDPGETDPLAIAQREGAEETGLKDLAPWPDEYLRHAVIVDVPAGKGEPAHQHADLRFVLATDQPEQATAESPGAPLRWLTVAGAEAEVGQDNLRETLRRVGPLLAAGPSAGAAPVALAGIDAAAAALQATAEELTAEQARAPSLLPGWTRGHVLTHVARNADALASLLYTARTGEPRAAYASAAARVAAIDAGAARSPADLAADLAGAAAAWRAEAAALPPGSRFTVVAVLGDAFPAAQVFTRRLHEIVLHHTDLGAGYGPADWPAAYADLVLPPNMAAQRADRSAAGA